MKLALRELWRQPGRFTTAAVILTLIAILLMFLGSLLDGLIRNATGAIRAQDGAAIVYSEAAEASFLRSRIEPATRAEIATVEGVADTGGLGVVQLGARVPGNGPRDLANVAVWGYEIPPEGVPAPPADGDAYADEVLQADGVELGDELLVGPSRTPVTVVGFVEDTAFNGQGGLWANTDTWHEVLDANRPDAALADDVFQAVLVTSDGSVSDEVLTDRINTTVGASIEAFTIPDAINAIPGVTEQQATFNQILGVTVVIALVVIALFFALLTVERTALYGVLKAIGARSGTIFGGLVAQALVVTLTAAAVAGVAVVVLDLVIPPGSIPIFVSFTRILGSTVLLLLAAIVGCAFSLRRVLGIDPASALGG